MLYFGHTIPLAAQIQPLDHLFLKDACTVPTNSPYKPCQQFWVLRPNTSHLRDCINSWWAQTGGAAGKERGRHRGRGNLKCWAPAVNSSCFCFRVINVALNRGRAWAPVSAAFNAISSPGWAGSGGGRFGFPAIPSKWGNVSMGAGGRAQPGGLTRAPRTPTALQKPLQRATHPSHPATLINGAAKAGTPTLPSSHAWIRYIPPALPDVSIPSSPDRAIIYQVVSRVVGEGGPGGRGFVSSLCWSSTGPSSLVSSQLLRVAGVREQMLKGLPFICRLILLPFHFILPASGMLLAYTPPHPPHYHSAWISLKEQELIFHVLVSSPVTSPLSLWEYFLPLFIPEYKTPKTKLG